MVLYGEVDSAWFERMEELEEEESWDELKTFAAFVLAHDKLTDKEQAWTMYYAGRVYLEEDKGALCLAYARRAALELPAEVRPQLLLALAEFNFGSSMRAEDVLISLMNKYPDSLDLILTLGRANERNAHWSAARSWYSKAAGLEPEDSRIQIKVALMLWMEGYPEAALGELDKILEKDSSDVEALNDQGIINLALGRFKLAGTAFDKAVSIDPAYADARLNRANLYASKGEFDKALADLEAGLAANPSNVKLLLTQGQIYCAQGKYFDAYSSFETAHVFERRNPHVLNELAWFLGTCPDVNLRNGKRAVTLAEQAILYSKVPDPGAYDTLAAAYAASGRYAEAVLAEETALYMAAKAGIGEGSLQSWQARKSLYEQGESYFER